jgi:hypothetical protein
MENTFSLCKIFKKIIQVSVMLKTHLSPCANLLYYWIQSHSKANQTVQIDWPSFHTWTEEFLEKPASRRESYAALSQLSEMNLITVEETVVKLNNDLNNAPIDIPVSNEFVSNKSNKNNPLFLGLFMTFGCLVVGIFSLTICANLSKMESATVYPTNPFQVLAERD